MTLKKLCHFSESELGIDFVAFTAVMWCSLCARSERRVGSPRVDASSARFVNRLCYHVRPSSRLLVTPIISESDEIVALSAAVRLGYLHMKLCETLISDSR